MVLRRIILAGLVLVTLCLVVVGCGGLGTLKQLLPPSGGNQTPIVGTFKLTQIQAGGVSTACPGSILTGTNTVSCTVDVRTFNADGSWTATNGATATATGTWLINGSNLTLSQTGQPTMVGTLSFTPDLSTFTYTSNGVTYLYARQ